MAALTAFRSVIGRGDDAAPDYYPAQTIANAITIFGGSLLFLNSSGEIVVASPDQTMTCVGFNDGSDIDNTGDGETINPRRGVIDLANNGSSITADDIGKLAYVVDNQTVDLSSSSGTRCVAGSIEGVLANGRVLVKVGMEAARSLQVLEAVQPIDADLTALAALATTGLAARTGAGTWATRTLTAPVAGITVTNGDGVSGNPTLVLADDLAALEALDATGGVLAKTAANTYARRTITAGSSAVGVTNGDGVAGNPTVDASLALTNVSALAGTGILVQTGGAADNGTFAERTIAAGSTGLVVSNGNGVAGNPTIDNLFAPISVADPGTGAAIPVTRSATIPITTGGGAETNTLAIPTFLGQRLILTMDVDGGGDRVITAASAINVAGNTIMTFGEARDTIELIAIQLAGVLAWQVNVNTAVALS